jgi:cobalt-zinc-cadmium efflux system membrane fusion protein
MSTTSGSRGPAALALAAVLAAPLASGCGGPAHAAPAPPAALPPGQVRLQGVPDFVRIKEVEVSSEATPTEATGKVAFDEGRVSRVGAPVSGRILELRVQPGDHVRKGQPLVVIASPDAESAFADWIAARADAVLAEKNLERQRRLLADQAVSQKEVLQAEGDATKARAARARALGRLEVLGISPDDPNGRPSRYLLRSPIDGVVVERPANPGMEVRADSGASLVTVADLTRLWVLADVFERDVGSVTAGGRAEVRVAAWPGRVWQGKIAHVGDVVDPQTRTVKVRVEVQNPEQRLKPEMFARVTLSGGTAAQGLTVPAQAVLTDGAASAVVVALGDGRFERRTVEAGPERDGHVRILSGLAAGERVVVDGAIYLSAAATGVE